MFNFDYSLLQEHIFIISVSPSTDTASNMVGQIRNLALETAHIQNNLESPLYRIMSFEGEDFPYIELVVLFAEEGRRRMGTFSDNNLHNMLCVQDKKLKEDIEHLLRRYRLSIPILPTVEDAIQTAHVEIYNARSSSTNINFNTYPLSKLI